MTESESGIERFLEKQEKYYDKALEEIKNGEKKSCWMWFIFPQLKGLGESTLSNFYGIKDIEEAIQYLNNKKLRDNLLKISQALIDLGNVNITKVFGYIDEIKLKSCMTLFNEVEEKSDIKCKKIFKKVLNQFFNGEKDQNTLNILEKQKLKKEKYKEDNKDKKLLDKNEDKNIKEDTTIGKDKEKKIIDGDKTLIYENDIIKNKIYKNVKNEEKRKNLDETDYSSINKNSIKDKNNNDSINEIKIKENISKIKNVEEKKKCCQCKIY